MWQKVLINDAFCDIMPETAAEQKESRSPEAPADIVILFVLMIYQDILESLSKCKDEIEKCADKFYEARCRKEGKKVED